MTSVNKIILCIYATTSMFFFGCSKSNSDAPAQVVVPEAPAPSASTLLKPLNNTVCEDGKVVSPSQSEVAFSWDPSQNTDTYELRITNLTTNTSITRSISHPTTSVNEILTRGVPYSWQIKSKSNKTTKTAETAEWKFYLSKEGNSSYAPFPATIVSPKPGEIIASTDGKLTLSWTGSDPDAGSTLSYQVFVDTSLAKVNNLEPKPIASTTNSTIIPVLSNTVYYWRIKTSDGQNSSYTISYSFKTK
jgi:hypothetical protein